MHRRVFIVHGWGGTPDAGWFPWLSRDLQARGFAVTTPALPETDSPRIFRWVPALAAAVQQPDNNTYFVGHSMGCQTIARYLETLPAGVTVGGAVFVAGFFKRLSGIGADASEQETDRHWLTAPINLRAVRSHLPRSIAFFSDDDAYVPLENRQAFEELLQSEIVVRQGMRHFSGSDGITALPMVRDAILKLSAA